MSIKELAMELDDDYMKGVEAEIVEIPLKVLKLLMIPLKII